MSDPSTQDDFGELAKHAARRGNARAMVEALWQSRFVDGLAAQLRGKWSRLTTEDVDAVIAISIDVVYERIRGGSKLDDVFPYLFKVARNLAAERSEMRPRAEVSYDPERDDRSTEDGKVRRVREDQLPTIYAEARVLIGRIQQERIKQVMGYLLDAIQKGAHDISNAEIADSLGLTIANVKTLKKRGFDRLRDLAAEEGTEISQLTTDDFWLDEDDEQQLST